MNEIAEIVPSVCPDVSPQSSGLAGSAKTRWAWLPAAGAACAAVGLCALYPEPLAAWLESALQPEKIGLMLSTAVGLATWAATRGWAHEAEIPVPPRDDLARDQTVLKDRLGRGVVDATERSQYHLRRHLEVGVVRQLEGVALLARLLKKRLAEENRPEAPEAGKIMELVERTISEARLIAAEAHPPEIETEGLEAALRRMAEEAEKYQTYCRVVEGASCPKTDAATSLQLYRVVQAIVERAARHGTPHHILIELAAGPEKYMSMTVTDRVGYGEKLPELTEAEVSELQARVRTIGGALMVEHPAGGLRLTCRMMAKGPKLQS